MAKVLITPRSYGTVSQRPLELLEEYGVEVIQNSKLTKERLKELVQDVDGIIAGVDIFDEAVLERANKLVGIAKYGVGVDNIDLEYCEKNSIEVSRTVGANTQAVADYAFALILGVARRIAEIDSGCRQGDFSKKNAVDVMGKKLGIIGFGSIGQQVAKRACGFDMELYGTDPYWNETRAQELGVTHSSVDEIVENCDFISLHLPLTPETHHLINKERIAKMKPTAILINTARGGLVDEEALLDALTNKRIRGAGLDVFEVEPASETPFVNLENVILGSHCAASTEGAVDQMGLMATEQLIEVLKRRGRI